MAFKANERNNRRRKTTIKTKKNIFEIAQGMTQLTIAS
jgi:hypothetical protein